MKQLSLAFNFLLFFAIMTSSALAQDLVAYLPLNDDYTDESGTGIQPYLLGNPDFGDPCGVGLDGYNDAIEYPYNVIHQPEDEFTISCWVWYQELSPGHFLSQLVNNSNYAPPAGYYLALDSDAKVRFRIRGDAGEEQIVSPESLEPEMWHHLVGIFDGDFLILYVDGIAYVADVLSESMHYQANLLRMGYHATNDPDYYRGILDEIRLYNGALTEAEVFELLDMGPSCEITPNTEASWSSFKALF